MSNFKHICPVVVELSHSDRQVDGRRTDMTNVTVTFCKWFAEAPKNVICYSSPRSTLWTTNPSWTAVRAKPVHRSDKLATNGHSNDTA